MDQHTMVEEAYKNGYAKGLEEGRKTAVVHGRWEQHPNHSGFDRCSICHNCIVANDWVDGIKWKFCPECGAMMRKEVQDE